MNEPARHRPYTLWIVVVLAVILSGVCFGPGGAGVAAMCGWIALRDGAP